MRGQAPIESDGIRIDLTSEAADLSREGHLKLVGIVEVSDLKGQIEDMRSDLIGSELAINVIELERLPRGADGMEVPCGREKLVVNLPFAQEELNFGRREPLLELFGTWQRATNTQS